MAADRQTIDPGGPTAVHCHFQLVDGEPALFPADENVTSLIHQSFTIAYAEGWEAVDGEELAVLLLRDDFASPIAALPAPIDDRVWMDAFDHAMTVLTVDENGDPKRLRIVPL